MPTSQKPAREVIIQLQSFLKNEAPNDLSPHTLVFRLHQAAPDFLHDPAALDLLLTTVPQLDTYRGKGTHLFKRGLLRTFQSILVSEEFGDAEDLPQKDKKIAFQKIANFALPRARGDGKKVRSHSTTELRQGYFELLAELIPHCEIPEALTLAKATAKNEKASLPERSGATTYLLAHISLLQEKDQSDPESQAIISELRDNPPSRDLLFQILDAGVESGETDQLTALIELEDWDEQNED